MIGEFKNTAFLPVKRHLQRFLLETTKVPVEKKRCARELMT